MYVLWLHIKGNIVAHVAYIMNVSILDRHGQPWVPGLWRLGTCTRGTEITESRLTLCHFIIRLVQCEWANWLTVCIHQRDSAHVLNQHLRLQDKTTSSECRVAWRHDRRTSVDHVFINFFYIISLCPLECLLLCANPRVHIKVFCGEQKALAIVTQCSVHVPVSSESRLCRTRWLDLHSVVMCSACGERAMATYLPCYPLTWHASL